MIKKILIFEFITGGGLAQQTLPESLAKEGLMMLKALVADLEVAPSIQITVLLDWRCQVIELPDHIEVVVITSKQSIDDLLPEFFHRVDYFFPIAPEMDKMLQTVTAIAEQYNVKLLNSSSDAVEICSDKLVTARLLKTHALKTVDTILLSQFSDMLTGQWVVKPRDGVGSLNSYLVGNKKEFDAISKQILSKPDYIVQPYEKGDLLSLSCLFKEGKAWLICCNKQCISMNKSEFSLDACVVNVNSENLEMYQNLINQLASVISGLFGYVGIDIIQPEQGQPIILEINPRLTTSFVGINQAVGFNVVKAIINMIETDPVITKIHNKQVTVSI